MRSFIALFLLCAVCSIPSPKAPSWDITGTVPLIATTVYVREIAESEDEFFFGDYGPWRFMDIDSVLVSDISDSICADYERLQDLPANDPETIYFGPEYWGENPLDEIEEPVFYRAWLEIKVEHNLPGDIETQIRIEGWDDLMRSCGMFTVDIAVPRSDQGERVDTLYYLPQDEVLDFVNPSAAHAVPDSFSAVGTARYSPYGQPVNPDAFLCIKVSLLTALDLSFETTTVARRSVTKKLIIAPEDEEIGEADLSGDIANKLRSIHFDTRIFNNIPVGGLGFFKLARDSSSLGDNPDVLLGPFDITPAPFDPVSGKSIGTSESTSGIELTGEDVSIFYNYGADYDTVYANMEYILSGTGEQRVCVSALDYIRLEAIAAVTALVEPGEEE